MLSERDLQKRIIESVLFSNGESVSLDQFSRILSLTPGECKKLVQELASEYDEDERGMQILELDGRYQMTSRPRYYNAIRTLYRSVQRTELTEAQLETLAIVLYKQPVTKQEIDDIRGVHSDGVVNRLLEFGLIEEVGRMKVPGRPILLGTSEAFLRNFGIKSLKEVPKMPEETVEKMDSLQMELDIGDAGVDANGTGDLAGIGSEDANSTTPHMEI